MTTEAPKQARGRGRKPKNAPADVAQPINDEESLKATSELASEFEAAATATAGSESPLFLTSSIRVDQPQVEIYSHMASYPAKIKRSHDKSQEIVSGNKNKD